PGRASLTAWKVPPVPQPTSMIRGLAPAGRNCVRLRTTSRRSPRYHHRRSSVAAMTSYSPRFTASGATSGRGSPRPGGGAGHRVDDLVDLAVGQLRIEGQAEDLRGQPLGQLKTAGADPDQTGIALLAMDGDGIVDHRLHAPGSEPFPHALALAASNDVEMVHVSGPAGLGGWRDGPAAEGSRVARGDSSAALVPLVEPVESGQQDSRLDLIEPAVMALQHRRVGAGVPGVSQ